MRVLDKKRKMREIEQFSIGTGENTYNLRMSNNLSNKLLCAVFLSNSSQNTTHNNLFDKLFCQITFGDVFLTSHQIKADITGLPVKILF